VFLLVRTNNSQCNLQIPTKVDEKHDNRRRSLLLLHDSSVCGLVPWSHCALCLGDCPQGGKRHGTGLAGRALQYWLTIHTSLLWIVETQFDTYADSASVVVTALNLPAVLSVILLTTSKQFRGFVDQLSLTFFIETVEAVPRILVGFVFLLLR